MDALVFIVSWYMVFWYGVDIGFRMIGDWAEMQ